MSFHLLHVMTSQNILTRKFTINKLHDFITKKGKHYQKSGQLWCITKQSNWHYKVGQVLECEAVFATKWGNYYKVGQYSIIYFSMLSAVSSLISFCSVNSSLDTRSNYLQGILYLQFLEITFLHKLKLDNCLRDIAHFLRIN